MDLPKDLLVSVRGHSVNGALSVGLRRAQEHFGRHFEIQLKDHQVRDETETGDERPTYLVRMTFAPQWRHEVLPVSMWGRMRRAILSR
jgi:hypothetical protein